MVFHICFELVGDKSWLIPFNISFYLLVAYFMYMEFREDKEIIFAFWAVLWVIWAIVEASAAFMYVPYFCWFAPMIVPLVWHLIFKK